VAVSQEYLDRGMRSNKRSKHPLVVYLGATLSKFFSGVDEYSNKINKNDNEFWVIYTGTLGSSYDLTTILAAAKQIKEKGISNIRFMILGQGPDSEMLVQYAEKANLTNVSFLGFKPYGEMAAYLCKSNVCVNAVKKNASQSIINKVADYLAAGIPMLNSCTCKEQLEMIDNYKVGLNYEPGNSSELVEKILFFYKNRDIANEFGKNARNLALEKFDRERTHLQILNLIDEI